MTRILILDSIKSTKRNEKKRKNYTITRRHYPICEILEKLINLQNVVFNQNVDQILVLFDLNLILNSYTNTIPVQQTDLRRGTKCRQYNDMFYYHGRGIYISIPKNINFENTVTLITKLSKSCVY